jgi:hypothetical protein
MNQALYAQMNNKTKKKKKVAVILATQEAEIRRIVLEASPGNTL